MAGGAAGPPGLPAGLTWRKAQLSPGFSGETGDFDERESCILPPRLPPGRAAGILREGILFYAEFALLGSRDGRFQQVFLSRPSFSLGQGAFGFRIFPDRKRRFSAIPGVFGSFPTFPILFYRISVASVK